MCVWRDPGRRFETIQAGTMAEAALLDPTDIAVDYELLVRRIVRLMRASEEPLTLDDLAEIAGLSPYHFARVFRSIAGIPPVEFQTALRFERAKTLLLTSPASVTEVCFEVGYESLGTFSRRFKQMVGITPQQFRDMPEIIAGMDLRAEITRRDPQRPLSGARIEGTVVSHGPAAHIYIGLFPDNRPGGRPVVGQMLPEPGPYQLPHVPVGSWHLMAAALPYDADPIGQLLPTEALHVGGAGVVEIRTGTERIQRTVALRPVSPIDVPVMTALPALLL
jgi:AraC-like DNA-binding protein